MGADVAAWEPLIGSWASSGRTVDAVDVEGTDVYEWLPGRQFVVHRVDVRMCGEQVDVLEVIGERAGDAFLMRSFDHHGGTAVMRATVDDAGVWTFAGPTERATLAVAPDGESMTARWERLRDGSWEHWMDMRFRRDAPEAGLAGMIADSMRPRSSDQQQAHRITDQGEMVVKRSSGATIWAGLRD